VLPIDGDLPTELSTAERHFDVQESTLDGGRGGSGRLIVFRDITERKHAEEARRLSEERFRTQYVSSPIPTYSWRRLPDADDFELVDYNDAARDYIRRGPFDRGARASEMIYGLPDILNKLHRAFAERATMVSELNIPGFGGGMDMRTTYSFVEPDLVVVHAEDITESKKIHRQLEHQARHDALTGLPNRLLLSERLQQAITQADADGSQVALLLLDLDRFKDINDSLGHGSGDALLQVISQRLADLALEIEHITIARVGGDEFAILLPGTDSAQAGLFATQVRKKLEVDVVLDHQAISPRASIGTALYPDHAGDADVLMRRADMAMYSAKSSGAGCLVYSSEYDRRDPERLAMIGDLRAALESDGLLLHYQPKFDLASGRIVGARHLCAGRTHGAG
jgi:diguanylate cyclase (GGDEF)-like protein